MIAGALLGLAGVGLLGAGTPRQAEGLFGARCGRTTRKTLRAFGLMLLILSLGMALGGSDRSRQFIGWVGVIGIEALGFALAFTLSGWWRARSTGRPRLDQVRSS